ncbi:MAG: ATP-binding protein [Thermoleophilaceae bacterium]
MDVPQRILETLPADIESVPVARELASDVGTGLMEPAQLDNLTLVVTELVSNAVRHAESEEPVRLAMTPKNGYICVQVTDSGRGLVPEPGAIGGDAIPGYGLFLVEALTRRWGMTREGGCTRVWVEIDFAEAPADDPRERAPVERAA